MFIIQVSVCNTNIADGPNHSPDSNKTNCHKLKTQVITHFSPFLSISHIKSSHGANPTGPHRTKSAISDFVKSYACMAEIWIGPQVFHTIPCINANNENRVRTSHLLLYTLLNTAGSVFVSGCVGTRSGSLSASLLGPAPIAFMSMYQSFAVIYSVSQIFGLHNGLLATC